MANVYKHNRYAYICLHMLMSHVYVCLHMLMRFHYKL